MKMIYKSLTAALALSVSTLGFAYEYFPDLSQKKPAAVGAAPGSPEYYNQRAAEKREALKKEYHDKQAEEKKERDEARKKRRDSIMQRAQSATQGRGSDPVNAYKPMPAPEPVGAPVAAPKPASKPFSVGNFPTQEKSTGSENGSSGGSSGGWHINY